MTDRSLKVVYIAGSGRSGSTLLERILGHVPGFLPAGELENIWHRGFRDSQLCSCGRPFLQCEFWTSVVSEAYGSAARAPYERLFRLNQERNRVRFIPQLRFPALRTASFAHDLGEYQEGLLSLYRSLIQTTGATAIVDSSKTHSYAFLLATLPEIDLYVVHLVRDSRAVSYSWNKTVVRPEVATGTEFMGGFRSSATARRWNLKNVLAEFLRFSSRAYVRLRYEDLVEDPRGQVSRILRATGDSSTKLPQLGNSPNIVTLPPVYHTVSGNPIRFEHEALRIQADMEWCTMLDARSKFVITSLTLPLLLRYGYTLSTRDASTKVKD